MQDESETAYDCDVKWSGSVLAKVDWSRINQVVSHEQKRREKYAPFISLYRWWARRPHSLIGAILDAAAEAAGSQSIRVADPFSGGGTVALEAAIRRFPVYAQDLYPWPTFSLATGLSKTSVEELEAASADLLHALEPYRGLFRRPDGRELSHILRVRVAGCPSCSGQIFLFPNPMFSLASRSPKEREALYGCRSCGCVTRRPRDEKIFCCPACGWEAVSDSKRKGVMACPHCAHEELQHLFYQSAPSWEAVLVQEPIIERGRSRAWVREVEPDDPVKVISAAEALPELAVTIPDGIETRRLLIAGFQTWGDLYTARQARVILTALKRIRSMDVSDGCLDRLALAVIGAAEMPAFLSRWDRYHLKAYEGLANHRYAHTTLAVETNLLAPMGRGTLLNRFKAALSALDWTSSNLPHDVSYVRVVAPKEKVEIESGVMIATGDSSEQGLADRTVDVVLTDPPYFDDIQYGELARLFHFWLSHYREIPEIDESLEAVPNRHRGNGSEFYESAISKCLQESSRTLTENGKLILTFHNRELQAWQALARSLAESGFVVRAMAAARTENSADLTKRNGRRILHDLVLECDRCVGCDGSALTFSGGESDEERGMLAMGLALEEVLRQAAPGRLADLYESHLQRLGVTRSCIQCGGTRFARTPSHQEPSGMVS